jgi:two-component system, OmpR family, sensor kinase
VSIRLRVAAVFAVALAVAFTLGSWLFVDQLSVQLISSTDAGLAVQLSGAGQFLPKGSRPAAAPPIRPGSATAGEYLIQLIDATGRVRYASQDAGTAPLLAGSQLRQAQAGQVRLTAALDGDSVRLLAAPVTGHPGWVALAGISLEFVSQTLSTVTAELLIGGGAFVLIGGLGAYLLARAALSPVERLRREVAALSERDIDASVRVPGTRDEIAALAGTMNDLLARLHGALARQRGFVADASHELRTPLAVLGGELELAGRPGRSRAELVQAVGNAADEVARLTRITNDLLVLARSDEDRLTAALASTDVRALLDRSAELAAGRAAAAGIGVAVSVDAPTGLHAMIDPDRMRQAVDNLIDNALRFAPAGTQVTVAARAAGSDLVIEVADAGPGFPAGFLPRAFERFGRPDTGRARSDGGAGLGLAIVQAIAAAHGGRATARNRPVGGAAITIDLPGALSGAESSPASSS